MKAPTATYTRFERTLTDIVGYQLVEGEEKVGIKIPISASINNTVTISTSRECVDDLLAFINSKL